MEDTIYIYSLIDPQTNEVRYIGKSINPKRRYYEHIKYVNNNNSHKSNWIKKILSQGLKPRLEIIEECDLGNWETREKYWISQYFNLTNGTDGGEDGRMSHEVRERLRVINSGEKNPCYGKVWTDEERKKLSDSRRKVKLTEEWKDNIGKTLGHRCEIDGVVYRSKKQASILLGVSDSTIDRRIKSDNYPNYKICL
jgi:group I intron endonuclease